MGFIYFFNHSPYGTATEYTQAHQFVSRSRQFALAHNGITNKDVVKLIK